MLKIRKPQTLLSESPGLYDLWAIEFGYTKSGRRERRTANAGIAARYRTDWSMVMMRMICVGRGIDPHINIYDHSGDAVGYAEQRLQLVRTIRADLLTTMG